MDKKLIIGLAICGGITLVWTIGSQFQQGQRGAALAVAEHAKLADGGGAAAAPKAAGTAKPADATKAATPAKPAEPAKPAIAPAAAAPAAPARSALQYVAKHELYTAKFVDQGATLTSFELTKYKSADHKGPMNLVGGEISDPGARPFALDVGGNAAPPAQDLLYGLHDCSLTLRPGTELADTLTCTWTDKKKLKLTKRVKFLPNSYLLEVEVELENLTETMLSATTTLQITAYQAAVSSSAGCFSPPPDLATPICLVKDSVERGSSEDIVKKFSGRQRLDGEVKWTGVDLRYFLSAAVARDGADAQDPKLTFNTNTCELVVKGQGGTAQGGRLTPARDLQLAKREAGRAAKPAVVRFSVFMGPKLHKMLEAVTVDKAGAQANPQLEKAVDFWILAIICKPMLWLLNFFYGFAGNYGIAIILLTLVVKIITFWPSQKSYRSMEGMKKLKKPMEELRAKYANDKNRLNQEMMALYKTHKINPLGGCLPLLIQMPIWIALYRTIYSSVEIYQQPFFGWIQDLSAQDPYYVLPLLLGAVMFVQQRMTPSTGDSSQMKLMLYGMPVLFTAMMLFFPSGLVLYIFVNTVLSIAQQWLIKRSMAKS